MIGKAYRWHKYTQEKGITASFKEARDIDRNYFIYLEKCRRDTLHRRWGILFTLTYIVLCVLTAGFLSITDSHYGY